ncbi:MAG TPA: translation initiation factor IF-3 [bacterium]|nr:translation initiation factor IF-3 [bacterium]
MVHIKEKDIRINTEIRAEQVRVIGAEGEALGVMSAREAQYRAEQSGLDLVEISPSANPPVCKIMNFGKYRYELRRKARDARKKQHVVHLKEVKMRLRIGDHDYEFKKDNIVKFLERGDKVKVTIMFYGREMAYTSHGDKLCRRLAEDLADKCKVESNPRLEGRNMIMNLQPK